jgi:hypothetical protein
MLRLRAAVSGDSFTPLAGKPNTYSQELVSDSKEFGADSEGCGAGFQICNPGFEGYELWEEVAMGKKSDWFASNRRE